MVGVVGILLYGAGVFIIFQCIFVYIPLVYPRYAASLFAGNDFSRSAFAFGFILFSRFMFIDLGVDKGVTLLAGLSVLGIVSVISISCR
jgi:DHA1 family multidrug resistance protein-like MFS transporter